MKNLTLLFFILLTITVAYLQSDLLKPAMGMGLTPDDWSFILKYKTLGPDPLSKLAEVWSERGAYTTNTVYYIGVLNSIFGFNYYALEMVNIFFKTLATLTIFPLVLLVFKNRLLAFLTTILFAVSYTTTGQLEVVVEGSEYVGMLFMNIFLIAYYYVIQSKSLSWKWLSLATVLLLSAVMISTIRLYPMLLLIILIEFFLWVQNRSFMHFRTALIRLIVLFLPYILVFIYRPGSILGFMGIPKSLFPKIIDGNWHLALTPLQGLGHIFPINPYWGKIFRFLNVDSFESYLSFILLDPIIIFGFIIILLSILTSKKPWRFFLLALLANLFLEILVFFIATHRLSIPMSLRMNFDSPRIYSTLFGLFILVLAFSYWFEWRAQSRKDSLFIAAWFGPAAAFLFIFTTWMLADVNLGFGGPQDHYLLIPTFGISLFLATLLTLIINRIRTIQLNWLKIVPVSIILIFIIGFYLLNKNLIYTYFTFAHSNGRSAKDQQMIQSKFREKIKNVDLSKQIFFYFDPSEIGEDGRFFTESFLSSFPFWMRFQGDKLIDGCIEVFYEDKAKLAKLIVERNGEKGFIYRSFCVENGTGGNREIFSKPDNFYAFKLRNKDFIDIKEEVLKDLGF